MLYVMFLFLVEKIKKKDVIQIKFVFLILNFKSEALPKIRISWRRILLIGSLDIKVLTSFVISWIYGQSQKMCKSDSLGAGKSFASRAKVLHKMGYHRIIIKDLWWKVELKDKIKRMDSQASKFF